MAWRQALRLAAAAMLAAAGGCSLMERDLARDGGFTVERAASSGFDVTGVSVTARGGGATVRGWLERERWRNWDATDRRVTVEVIDAGGKVLERAQGSYQSLGRRLLGAAFIVPLKAVPPAGSVVRVVVE